MEHSTEERTNLLTPLRYKEGLSFPTAAKSETDFSPSSTTLPESHYKGQWIRLGITAAMIVGLLFGATFTAVLHLFILRGRAVSSQFWIKNSSNALSTLVQWLCAGKSNFSELQWNPILSARARRVLDHALQSETLNGWNAPVGCGIECSYTIQYTAPVLRCTELSLDEVNALLPDSQSLPTIYNSTDSLSNPTAGSIQYSPKALLAHLSSGDKELLSNNLLFSLNETAGTFTPNSENVLGALEQILVKGQENSAFDTCWCDKSAFGAFDAFKSELNQLTYDRFDVPRPYLLLVTQSMQIAVKLPFWSQDSAQFLQLVPRRNCNGTVVFTEEFQLEHQWIQLNRDSTMTRKSIMASIDIMLRRNLIHKFYVPLVNTTVAMITSMGHTTLVNASVVQDQLVWVYHGQRLWIIYATALGLTATCGGIALVCMLKNGGESDLTFWDIVRATRSSDLDTVVEGERLGDAGKDTMLQYEAVKGMDADRNASGVFVLARPRHEGSS
ncbi:hypothetical protein EV421DRAFT_2024556 [Armillaria borealis]|uniref:Uncharacterized protein n=1 Tax=Armillaria borealis TaxID=47425 RepID=A0AA39IWZ8_9AGAR|nr:hypothetical protein EV421DRAFT_2024556 [Armillaria borealis]